MFENKSGRLAWIWHTSGPILGRVALGGALAGLCNGLLGAGGGIIAVLFLSSLTGGDAERRRSVYVNALCVMLPLSALTLFRYASAGATSVEIEPYTALGAVVGGVVGGLLLGRMSGRVTDRVFALMTVLSGLLMIIR